MHCSSRCSALPAMSSSSSMAAAPAHRVVGGVIAPARRRRLGRTGHQRRGPGTATCWPRWISVSTDESAQERQAVGETDVEVTFGGAKFGDHVWSEQAIMSSFSPRSERLDPNRNGTVSAPFGSPMASAVTIGDRAAVVRVLPSVQPGMHLVFAGRQVVERGVPEKSRPSAVRRPGSSAARRRPQVRPRRRRFR